MNLCSVLGVAYCVIRVDSSVGMAYRLGFGG